MKTKSINNIDAFFILNDELLTIQNKSSNQTNFYNL